ncbi:MAG: hypothetical protein KAJ33_03400 [Thermoplasmata archaeon]|nr:hypothetical protein [Thermoplasmata archaeon]
MISIYLLIAIICVILLAVFAVMGGIADFDVDAGADMDLDVGEGFGDFGGAGVSPLSLPVMLMWGTTFGAVGGMLESTDLNVYVIPAIAAIAGILSAALMFVALVKMSKMAQSDSAVNRKNLIGEDGEVWVPIKPNQPGKIVIETKERGRSIFTAIADEELGTGTPVEVIEAKTSGLKVKKLQGE